MTTRLRVNAHMKNSPRVNVKVAVIPQKDEAVQGLRNFVLIGFAVVGVVFLLETYMAVVLGFTF